MSTKPDWMLFGVVCYIVATLLMYLFHLAPESAYRQSVDYNIPSNYGLDSY